MGIRFQRSVRLGKYARLNLSKSGASVTTGVKGLSVNTGPKGVYLNAGIPGTGLSSRTKLAGPPGAGKKGGSGGGGGAAGQQAGGAAAGSAGGGAQSPEVLAALQAEQDTEDIVNIHLLAPEVYSYQELYDMYQAIPLYSYQRQPYQRPQPTQQEVEAALWQQAEAEVGGLLNKKARQQQYFQDNYQAFWQSYMAQWQQELANWEASEAAVEAQQNQAYQSQYEAQRLELAVRMQNDPAAIEDAVEEWLGTVALPVEMDAQIEYDPATATLYVDLDLPEIEDLPTAVTETLKSGTVKVKEKTQKQQRYEYARCVLGLAVFTAASVFDVNANIAAAVISGYTRRRNRAGELDEEYIYSAKIKRADLEHHAVDDPIAFISACESRLLLSQTHIFKRIDPYSKYEVD